MHRAKKETKGREAQAKLADLAAFSRISDSDALARKKTYIEAAMARARERKT